MRDLGRRAPAVVVGVAIALSCGCSGGSEPSTLPDVRSTPASSESQSPTPLPSTVQPDVKAEAVEFYLRYEDVSEESWTSAEAVDERRSMFVDSCSTCLAGYQFARRVHEEDLKFVGDPLPRSDVEVTAVADETVTLLVQSDVPAGRMEDQEGNVIERFDANPDVQLVVQVRKVDGQWVILKEDVL